MVRSGILKHILPVAILEREASINQDIKCFDSGDDHLNEWLALALRASANEILALNREGTTVQSVKYETLLGFELRVPPLSEQQRIQQKVNQLFERVEQFDKRLRNIVNGASDDIAAGSTTSYADRLTQGILAKAFRGELVPTEAELAKAEGRSYETAEELLTRVRHLSENAVRNDRPARAPMRARKAV